MAASVNINTMEQIPCHVIETKIFKPYGSQLKRQYPWYPQELCNNWPHHASALTLSESNVMKYGISYPLRTGLNETDEELDFPENTTFYCLQNNLNLDDKVVEEVFLSRGVCVISHGPLGGPSFLKGLYRPLVSYGTGVGISQVTKAKFLKPNQDNNGITETKDDTFICLVERGGVSIYAENSSETHVSHVPEFQIEKIMACKFGLLFVPSRLKKDSQTEYCKNIYVLTHPIKQVSRIWIRNRPIHDYYEYESLEERLIWCEDDLCVFWSLKNDKIFIRRLMALDKDEILQLSHLNTTLYQTSPELSSKCFHPSSSNSFQSTASPFSKQPFTRSVAMRVNREGGTLTYWPSFDFPSNSSPNNSMGHCFYPPHVCVYDDPEIYLTPLFQIDLPKSSWKEPRKFNLVRDLTNISLWFLIKHNLSSYAIDISSGTKLGNYVIKNIEDFTLPTGPNNLPVVILLDCRRKIRLGWLDSNYSIVCTSFLDLSSRIPTLPISSLEAMLFGDTIIYTIEKPARTILESGIPSVKLKKTVKEYRKVTLRNYRDNCLVRNCVKWFAKEMNSRIVTNIIARLTGVNSQTYRRIGGKGVSEGILTLSDKYCHLDNSWIEFVNVVKNVIRTEPLNLQMDLRNQFIKIVAAYKESDSISAYYKSRVSEFDFLLGELSYLQAQFLQNLKQEIQPLLPTFGYLLVHPNPRSHAAFEFLPKVMQLLLDNPDSLQSIQKLIDIEENDEKFIPLIHLLISDVYHRNSSIMKFSDPVEILAATGRSDYLCGRDTTSLSKSVHGFLLQPTEDIGAVVDDTTDESTWIVPVLRMRIFSEDRRLEEVCRLLDSSQPVIIETEQRAEMSDHEYVEEQEKHLMQLVQITFAAPIGRTALTLKTDDASYTSLTRSICVPKLTFAGKCKGKGTTVELSETDLPVAFTNWPHFHNAVAASLSVGFTEPPAEAWFAFNKAKVNDGPEQAGMVFGFGLNRILSSMPPTLRHDYLSKENSFTSMAMLLGLAANLAGTGDMSTWKLISLHIGAMLPACTTELEIPRLATLVAPCALGLLFLGTQNTYVAKVLLGEISKKFTPLSCFGSNTNNNSTSIVNPNENTGTTTDREAHSLCAGFGLGFVNLAKGKLRTTGFADDDFDGILRRFVVGGPKPVQAHGEDEEAFNQFEQTLPSMWEEYRCCHIEEGDNVNVDVTTPSAIIAVALTYLRTGNEAVLNWLAPPSTLHLLDGVRPDLLMLRSLASILVFEKLSCPTVNWLEDILLPKSLMEHALQEPAEFTRLNHESINQCWASIVVGYCLGLGIRYAGTSDHTVKATIGHYIDLLIKLSSKESKLCEFFPKNFLESCTCNLVLASSLVVAGTGEVSTLRLCRYLQKKVSLSVVTVSNNTYGLEMCISLATGILFLGGGRYSLSNDDRSIALLLASVFPKWPINANDNRYHLQALRHLYVLAAQPRLILPKPIPQEFALSFQIEFLDGRITNVPAPVLLPPFYLIKKIRMDHDEFFPIEFDLPKDLEYLNRIVENRGILNLVHKPIGSANYGFIREMSWRQDTNFHPTFKLGKFTSTEEREKINEFNLVHQLAEWSGMQQIVSPVLTLINGDPNDEHLKWQIRILHWWTESSASRNKSTCFPEELLILLRKRSQLQDTDLVKPTYQPTQFSISH